MNKSTIEAVAAALIKNQGYNLKTDLISNGMNCIELEKSTVLQQGTHLIMFNLDSEDPLNYFIAQPKGGNEVDKAVRKMLIEVSVNNEINKVIQTQQF